VLVGGPAVAVIRRVRAAKGRNLDHFRSAQYVHQAKTPPDDARAAEGRPDLLRRGAGGDIEVLGLAAEDEVAHRTADDERGESPPLQRLGRAQRAGADRTAVDPVPGGRY